MSVQLICVVNLGFYKGGGMFSFLSFLFCLLCPSVTPIFFVEAAATFLAALRIIHPIIENLLKKKKVLIDFLSLSIKNTPLKR